MYSELLDKPSVLMVDGLRLQCKQTNRLDKTLHFFMIFMDSSVYVVVLCAIVLYQLLWIVHASKIAVCIRYLCGETVMMNIYLVRVLELGLDPQHSHVMNSSCWTAFDIQLYLHVGTGVYDPFLCFHLEHVSWIYVAIFFTGWLRQKTPACPCLGIII